MTTCINLGISACLLGQRVRYDGNHKLDPFLPTLFGQRFAFIPICPEMEAGLGVPREPMRLEGDPAHPRAVTLHTRRDLTAVLASHAEERLAALATANLGGLIVTSRSPSCGWGSVPVYGEQGQVGVGSGIFARAWGRCFPALPVVEVGQLHQAEIREWFFQHLLPGLSTHHSNSRCR
ncbi:MAG: DUF523 domain-containing protein [Magnetococcales bacterium]|nr:DUF523 domain-containing protein [Magnetococcales bacterium]